MESKSGGSSHASSQLTLERDGTNYLQFMTANNGTSGILFGDVADNDGTKIKYDHNTSMMLFETEAAERLRIGNAGQIGLAGANYGTSGQFLQSQGASSAVQWASVSSDFVKIATATWTSAISSVTIDNLDTATYKYFRLLFNTVPSDQGRRLSFRWRKDGSDQTGAAYDWNFGETYNYSTSTLAENADKGEVTDDMGNDAWEGCQLEFVIYPKSSAESGYQGNTVFWHGIHYENAGYVRGINGSLFYDGGASLYLNGFKLYMNVGNLATGDYALYGVKR